jgi:type I restriction enzyme S subunit
VTWTTAPLGEIATIERNSVSPADIKSGSRYVGLDHIESGGGSIKFGSVERGELASNKFQFGSNHILFGKLRPYLAKVACPDFSGICSTDIVPIAPSKHVDKRYLLHFLRRPETIAWAAGRATGVNLPRLSPKELASLEIPHPRLEEQRRIAAVLDKADALRRKRKRTLDLLDSVTQSIFLEMFGDPLESKTSKLEPMGGVIREIESGWSPTCLDRAAAAGEHGVLKLGAITGLGFISEQNKALPPELEPRRNTEVVAGDILFCRKNTRELIGASVYVWNTRPLLHMSDLIFRIVPERTKIDSIFLQAQLSLASQRRKISEMSSGAAGSMPNVSKARLRDLQILVPRLDKQMKFSRVVQRHSALRMSHVCSLMNLDRLFSCLQSQAFSRQL